MTSPSAPSGARREQRSERRQRRRIIAAGVGVCALLAGGTAYALTAAGDESTPKATKPTSTKQPTEQATAAVDKCPDLTPDAPLELWIGGDSLAGSLGPSLGEMTAETGVVQPQFDSRVSSGLTSPEFFDWPEQATEQLATLDPDAVAFVIGTNDAKVAPTEGTAAQEWVTEYETLVDQMMTILIGPGRKVYWVGAPIMESDSFSEQVQQANDAAVRVAARHPEVTYVDAYARFSSPEGQYVTALDTGDDDTTTVRAGDGVHFTPDGGDYLAEAVFPLLDQDFCISQQAVPGAAKDVLETQGSTQVPGTSRDVSTPATTGTTPPPTGTTTQTAPTEPAPTEPTTSTTTATTTTTTTTTTSPGQESP